MRAHDGDYMDDQTDTADTSLASVIRVTNAPRAYDYETTVLLTYPLPGRTRFRDMNSQSPFRLVELDAREEGYYAEYQSNRYKSGGYLVLTLEQWRQWIANGDIVIPSAADEPMS